MIFRDYQQAFLNDTSRLILAGWARNTGKTLMMLERARRAKKDCIVVVESLKMTKHIIDKAHVYKIIRSHGEINVQFVDGGPVIKFVTPSYRPNLILEANIEALILHEPGYLPDEFVLNMLFAKAQQIYFIGTPKIVPKGKLDAFTTLYRLHKELGISVHQASFGDTLKERELDKLKEILPHLDEEQWKTEILGQFK